MRITRVDPLFPAHLRHGRGSVMAAIHLVRRRGSEYIHTSACRHATSGGVRWVWADKNPDVDWLATAPWLKACKRCNPPSPFRPIQAEVLTDA